MTELGWEDNQEEIGMNISEAFPKTMRISFDERPGMEPVSDGSDEEETSSGSQLTNSLYFYYGSLNNIPLLTREQEIGLAKRLESAKLNLLRCLSMTPIASSKVMELADILQPAAHPATASPFGTEEELEGENEDFSEREKARLRSIANILKTLDELEGNYRWVRQLVSLRQACVTRSEEF